jgi:PIN domain nuclease of toxin-antitoxin system
MSGYLLDTNVALYVLTDSPKLTPALRRALESGPNYLSVASYWEVLIKNMKGKLEVGDPHVWWEKAIKQLAARPLVIHPEHVETILTLPKFHKDPFDRLLIAQAIAENLTLLTTDAQLPRYATPIFQIIS